MLMAINVNCKREIRAIWIDKKWVSGVQSHADETSKSEKSMSMLCWSEMKT